MVFVMKVLIDQFTQFYFREFIVGVKNNYAKKGTGDPVPFEFIL